MAKITRQSAEWLAFSPSVNYRSFFADFYCHAAALVIEVDGEIHQAQQEYDQERTELIRDYGIEVIRFQNKEIFQQLPQVLEKIDKTCHARVETQKNE